MSLPELPFSTSALRPPTVTVIVTGTVIVPSLTSRVRIAVPLFPAAPVTLTVRSLPLPPSATLPFGRSAVFELDASDRLSVSPSASESVRSRAPRALLAAEQVPPVTVAVGAEFCVDPTVRVTVLSVLVEAVLALPTPSTAAPAGIEAMTVPAPVIPLTATS